MQSYNQIHISAAALKHNFRLLQKQANATPVLAMVKADGYGHGMVPVANILAQAGCSMFGVAEAWEGVTLRQAGIQGQIVVFLGCDVEQVGLFFDHDLTPIVFSEAAVALLGREAGKRNKEIRVHLKVDCGMGRLGVLPDQIKKLVSVINTTPGVIMAGAASHFPCSDDLASDTTSKVFLTFQQAMETIAASSEAVKPVAHIANSGGILYFPETASDAVRPGISLYGYYPDASPGAARGDGEKLQPVMSFFTRVVQVKTLPVGHGISYGHTFVTSRETRIAVLPVGYANGYLRSLGNKAQVLIHGRRAHIVGRVCMNLCMVDVTDLPQVQPGDQVVLLGSQGSETIDADEIGQWMGTISYEVLCLFGNSNPRFYNDQNEQ